MHGTMRVDRFPEIEKLIANKGQPAEPAQLRRRAS
jgi:hypothetical protein